MDVFREIIKQVNKVIRILTKVTEKHPKLSEEIDIALFASIKIEKIVNKYVGSDVQMGVINEFKITRNDDSQDAFFTSALESIQNFKNSTFKLERKINVLINEQEPLKTKKPLKNDYAPGQKHEHERVLKEDWPVKKGANKKIGKDIEQSRNLSDLDESIIQLTHQIKHEMVRKVEDKNEEGNSQFYN